MFSGLMAWMAATAGLARRCGIDGGRIALGWAALAAAKNRVATSTAFLRRSMRNLRNQVNCDPIVMERRQLAMLQKLWNRHLGVQERVLIHESQNDCCF